jgi:hypothetical protein
MAGDRLITPDEARQMLREVYASDGEINIRDVLRRNASDPIRPFTEKGRLRPSTPLFISCVMLFLLVAIFLYFSVGAIG